MLEEAWDKTPWPHPLTQGKHRRNFPASSQMLFVIIIIILYVPYISFPSKAIGSDFLLQSNGSEVLLLSEKAKLPAVSRTLRGQPAPHWVCCVQSLQTMLQTWQCSSPRTPDGQPATCKAQKHLSIFHHRDQGCGQQMVCYTFFL